MLFRCLGVAAAVGSLFLSQVQAKTFSEQSRKNQRAADRMLANTQPGLSARSTNCSDYRFYNENTEKYFVESLPDVNFDLGEMYSGLVPIDVKNESRALFFVFEPKLGDPVDEVTIWLNGGPGCSSLEGFFQENGRFLWQPGTYSPVENPYSWVNLTNMLWVEQPVGTGFSIGTPTATSQEETAEDFVNFFLNWEEIFGISNFKIYITGESYAGRYVPYISAEMLNRDNKTMLDISGALVYDPCIGEFVTVQEEIPVYPFVLANQNLFTFDNDTMAQLAQIDKDCGYEAYRDQYLVYPASGVQPPLYFNFSSNASCDALDLADAAALTLNNCFNIYEVNAQCPLLWDVLSFPTQLVYTYPGATTYFNRTDVKMAIHAPLDVDWTECSNEAVFVGDGTGPQGEGDTSADPIQHVLPQVIEATNRVLVSNGDFDMVIMTAGTLLAIQNMTWNGMLGFQTEPSTPINITYPDLLYTAVFADPGNYAEGLDGPQGVMGIQHYERGLMWAETFQSGHMQPEFQPRVCYRHLQWVLGRVDSL